MRSRAAVLYEHRTPWAIKDLEVPEPKAREVMVKVAATGLCHSDDHNVTGDFSMPLPVVGGHEGAGTVVAVGNEVTRAKVGDRVILSCSIACGVCRRCYSGRSYMCEQGAFVMTGRAPDGSWRFLEGEDVIAAGAGLGTFSEYLTVAETQVVTIEGDIPFDVASIMSCGVITGFGAALRSANVQPGETVVVVGVGGVGMSAVQGARIAGARHIVAVDLSPWRLEQAPLFGATHVAGSVAEAIPLVSEITRNSMADKVIVTVGVLHGDMFRGFSDLTAVGGTISVTSVAPAIEETIDLPISAFLLSNKTITGNIYGLSNSLVHFNQMMDLYRSGDLLLDEMVTNRYSLDEINQGYADMHAGKTIRGIVEF